MKMPAAVIREEISKSGVISFARFMELALYCPETGYYEGKKDNIGRGGDFITSVSAGSLFGELLGFQFAEWLRELPAGGRAIAEAGAHDGRLAADILGWLRENRAGLFEEIEYIMVEPSANRREWQRETLIDFAPRVRWVTTVEELKAQNLSGVFFGNELLDAFPIQRYGWDAAAKTWFEWGVGWEGEAYCWTRMDRVVSAAEVPCPPELAAVLPDGFIVEASPAALGWWKSAAEALTRGRLVAIDYGHGAEEVISPARTKGTLRAYFRHQVTGSILANPGEQDLTAHVNFDAVQKAGEAAGLGTETFCSQPQFLTRIFQRAVADQTFGALDARRVRQFQTLTHPEHLGRAFRVLVQARRG